MVDKEKTMHKFKYNWLLPTTSNEAVIANTIDLSDPIQLLSTIIKAIDIAKPNDDEEFTCIISESIGLLQMGNDELALEFGASALTVAHWINGTVFPHPAMRTPIYKYLKEKLTRFYASINPLHHYYSDCLLIDDSLPTPSLANDDFQITCPECRKDLGLPSL